MMYSLFMIIYYCISQISYYTILLQMSTFRLQTMQQEQIHSSCSIQETPQALNPHNSSLQHIDTRIKSKQYIADRFFPLRKGPSSLVQLFTDHGQWMEDEQERSQHKGISVRDVYKMEVLGQNLPKDPDDAVFTNENFLKFSQKEPPKENVGFFSRGLLQIPEQHLPNKRHRERRINKVPAKVLDAPALYDDFYLNLVDWSLSNQLAVGLSNSVYLWNAGNSKVVRLVQLPNTDLVTSCCSSLTSNILAVGTHSGQVQLWDCIKHRKIRTLKGHTARVGAIAWNNNHVLASGSRDKNIIVRDIRSQLDQSTRFVGHKQQVCGLKWSFDQQQLASGGNDNRLNIWSSHSTSPIFSLQKHTAAVKALAWSPHQHGLLVSGGGTADRTIRFWNSITGDQTKCLNVGSQVCNLMFSRTTNQLISTHGYSLNEINIWKMPRMQKLQTLTGHTYRVLYLAMSPDGTTIVTGAGDQTLRFWNIFPKKQKQKRQNSNLNMDSICLR